MTLEEIYSAHFADVYLYIRRLSGDEHMAEEITSDTFFKAMGAIDRFRGECDLRVWLCQIAKNCYYARLKKDKRITSLEEARLETAANLNALPDEQVSDRLDAQRLQSLLHTLPDPHKEVFMWRVYAELSFKQIGQIFNKTDNWACVTYHRARAMLKSRLEDQDNG